ncbi:MAG: ribosome assembly factor SBDS [Candidatus Ranarchaeia archaeon]
MSFGSGSIRGEKRIDIDKSGIIKYDTEGEHFELIVDIKLAWDYRNGKDVSINDILVGPIVFSDALRGKKSPDVTIEKIFETDEILVIAKIILDKGELKLTTEQKRKMLDQKRKQIINYLSKNAINPQTSYPHPPDRLDRAMEEAKAPIDPFRSEIEQAKEICKLLTSIIPIRLENIKMAFQIPSEYTGKGYGIIARFGNITKEEWQKDGSWVGVVELSGGLLKELLDNLNKLTKGRMQSKQIRSE